MDLQSSIQNKILSLKSCKTVVTDSDGNRYEIEHGKMKELDRGIPFVVDTKPDLEIAEIIPGVLLSSQDPLVDIKLLNEYKIRHILSVGIPSPVEYDNIKYYYCELLDLPTSDVKESIRTCVKIIHQNHKDNILIHCNAGVSRSPTIIISYLMIVQKLSFEEAFILVKRKRNCINPNDGFIKQLQSLNVSEYSEFNDIHQR